MTQEEKFLLLKDLCARLPYEIKVCSPDKKICSIWSVPTISVVSVINGSGQSSHPIEDIKPYLRPMSSMTEEEKKEFNSLINGVEERCINAYGKGGYTLAFIEVNDWLNALHFDYRGLIPIGLALQAPKDMYK